MKGLVSLGCGLLLALIWFAAPAHAARTDARTPHKPGPPPYVSTASPRALSPRAPSGPPLVEDTAGAPVLNTSTPISGDASNAAPASGGDPLVENGLGSPLCAGDKSDLSMQGRNNCATSGFDAASTPTGDYSLDVHIDTGPLGFTVATLEQDYLIAPVWMALVWLTHTLIVAIEWGFTLDLLDGAAMSAIEHVLRGARSTFTTPLLACALTLAAISAAYSGLVRRRITETLGQAGLMIAMLVGGLWVAANPARTVGTLGRWVDAASIGALGTMLAGSPDGAQRTLADGMTGLFSGVIGDPWCYLEFGAVRWCDEAALQDPRLRAAASRLASAAQSRACRESSEAAGSVEGDTAACQALQGESLQVKPQSAKLLRTAHTNGALFLALPANQAARNSINDSASLLRALCGGSSDATACRGPTAAEAEYRTQNGTQARIGGLLLIVLGALGMLLLFGYVAMHLLAAELLSLLYLLLAPLIVLAPTLGDEGRRAFRDWVTRLVGAMTTKFLFSFLLGTVLLLTHMLLTLSAFGWWTRWLLASAMWWGAYLRRRRLFTIAHAELIAGGQVKRRLRHSPITRRPRQSLAVPPLAPAWMRRSLRASLAQPGRGLGSQRSPGRSATAGNTAKHRAQAAQMLVHEHRQGTELLTKAASMQDEISTYRRQLARLTAARIRAEEDGDMPRKAKLGVRIRRVRDELEPLEQSLDRARKQVASARRTYKRRARPYTRHELERRERFLEQQAELASAAEARAPRFKPRDYATLASLAGYGREEYLRLDPRQQRETRLYIDHELALHSDAHAPGLVQKQPSVPHAGASDRAHLVPVATNSANGDQLPAAEESELMRDFREVIAGRKQRLGFDR